MLSAFQISLCTRAASLEVQLERLEARMSEGEEVDLDLFGRLAEVIHMIVDQIAPTPDPNAPTITEAPREHSISVRHATALAYRSLCDRGSIFGCERHFRRSLLGFVSLAFPQRVRLE
jgi:hypothetical protein